MLRKISSLGKSLEKADQKSINGGRRLTNEFDCASHYTFCDGAHPTSFPAFEECMVSCGC